MPKMTIFTVKTSGPAKSVAYFREDAETNDGTMSAVGIRTIDTDLVDAKKSKLEEIRVADFDMRSVKILKTTPLTREQYLKELEDTLLNEFFAKLESSFEIKNTSLEKQLIDTFNAFKTSRNIDILRKGIHDTFDNHKLPPAKISYLTHIINAIVSVMRAIFRVIDHLEKWITRAEKTRDASGKATPFAQLLFKRNQFFESRTNNKFSTDLKKLKTEVDHSLDKLENAIPVEHARPKLDITRR